MTCEELQFELLKNGGNASHAGLAHLMHCRDCREFAHALALSQHAAQNQTEVGLCNTVRLAMRRQKKVQAIRRWLRRISCAAAVVLLCFGLWQMAFTNNEPKPALAFSGAVHSAAPRIAPSNVDDLMTAEEECEIEWNENFNLLNDDLDLLESNLTLLACGF